MAELLEYTTRRTKYEISHLPFGIFNGEGWVDTDGYSDEPVRLQVRIEVGDAGVRFDTSGASQTGSRWQNELRGRRPGFVARHPSGL